MTAMWFLVFNYVKETDFQDAVPNTSEPKLHRASEQQANHDCEWKDGGRLFRKCLAATSALDKTFSWREGQARSNSH